jgi:hypothetical protein
MATIGGYKIASAALGDRGSSNAIQMNDAQ